jgi:hypothetical protein
MTEKFDRYMLRPFVRAGDIEREFQHPARRERIDNSIAMTSRGGVPGIEPAIVIGARLLDSFFQVVR